MQFNHQNLETLDITNHEFFNLSREQQLKKIQQQWIWLTILAYQGSNFADFQRITEAYINLMWSDLAPDPDSNNQLNLMLAQAPSQHEVPPVLPLETFDLLMQNNMLEHYRRLKTEFVHLNTLEAKQRFLIEQGDFIRLAQMMLQSDFLLQSHQRRIAQWMEQKRSLQQILVRDYRELVIRLFGEEQLDDFSYRQALATGDLLPILATRKLLSPVKWVAALFSCLSILVTNTVSWWYYSNSTPVYLLTHFSRQHVNYHQTGELSAMQIVNLILQCLVFLSVLKFAIDLAFFGFALGPMASCLEIIASPINQFIRPLAQFLGFSEDQLALFTLGLLALSCTALYVIAPLVTVAQVMLAVDWATQLVLIFSMYHYLKLLAAFYEKNPIAGVFLFLLLIANIALQLTLPSLTITLSNGYLESVLLFFVTLWINSEMSQLEQKVVDDFDEKALLETETLPLPVQNVSHEIQTTVKTTCTEATLSHRFFKTPVLAPAVAEPQQTWQAPQAAL